MSEKGEQTATRERVDAYLALIDEEHESRPSEVLLADEIHRLRAALEAAVANSIVLMLRTKESDHYWLLGRARHTFAYNVLHGLSDATEFDWQPPPTTLSGDQG